MKKLLLLIIQLMKWSFYGICFQALLIGLLYAEDGFSQQSLSVRDVFISAQFNNSSVKDVFSKVESQTKYRFAYDESDLSMDSKLNFTKKRTSVAEVLMEVARASNLKFKQVDNLINVSPMDRNDTNPVEVIRVNDNLEVSGRVTSTAENIGLPGVTILQKGTSNGSVSDIDGYFKITVPDTAILVFSSIGYITQEVKVNGRSTLEIGLNEDIQSLDEIVVVGYGAQKRSNLTGAISSVKPQDIENRPIIRLDQALQGMSSGVFVSKGGGAPGASPTIHIRGVGSINNTEPLWIVDGIKMSPGNHFNLDDVESIEILKDAAASSIYGAQAAHGVILVTTKRGSGKLQMTFKSSFAKVQPRRLPELLGSEEFVEYKKQSREAAGQNPEPSWDNWEYDTDWIDAYYGGNGFSQYYDFSVAQGTDKFNYYMSLGFDDENGILIDNDFKRYSIRVNSDAQLTNWLKIGESMLFSKVEENPIDNYNENRDASGNFTGDIPYRSIPIMPIYDDTNIYGGWGQGPAYFQGGNPVASQYQQHAYKDNSRLDGNIYLLLEPLKGLGIRTTLGYNYNSYVGKTFSEAFDYGSFANPINQLERTAATDETITANIVATYEKQIGTHFFKVMAGYESLQYEGSNANASASDFPVDIAWSFNLARGPINITNRYQPLPYRLLSQFGRVNYNYKEKYFLEGNIRRDASSRFGPNNRFGIFPSFSAAWRISEESFFEGIGFINNLKLRVSAGVLGSDNIGGSLFETLYTSQFSTYAYDAAGTKQPGFYISKYPNTDVKWEEVNMTNIGFDVAFLENKITLSADYYIKDTKDLLYGVPIPSSVGISTHLQNAINPPVNIGTMRNEGIDLDLVYKNTYGHFDLSVGTNVSFMRNELLHLNNDEYIIGGGAGGQINGMTITEAGQPISSFYGYKVRQMLNSDDEVYAINTWAADGTYQEGGTAPGDLMYWDISGPDGVPDGEITAHDRTIIGNPWPKMMYGININLSYKKMIDVMLQFQGVQGVDIFNANLAYSRNFYGDNNTTTLIREAWTPENPTDHPRNIASDPNGNFSKPSTYFIEDGSYLKLRNVQIGYTLPTPIANRLHLQRLRVYANANNIFTITKYSGIDPEIAGSNTGRGVDYGLYPHTRTYGGGIEIQF